jgi:large subunit ribosomal protein L25
MYAESVKLPAGVTLISDPKMVVVHLSERSTAAEPAAETTAAAAAPAAEEKKES